MLQSSTKMVRSENIPETEKLLFFVFILGSCVWLFATPWTVAPQASLSFTISWSLLKLMSIETVMPSNHLILCSPLLLLHSIFPASGSFPVSQLFASGGQSLGDSASASALPMNIQGWFPLGLIYLFSLLSKGLSRGFSNTTVWKHQFFSAQPSLWFNSHICTWLLEKPCICLVTQLCPTPCNLIDYSSPGSSVHGDSPGKNTGVSCHALLQEIFPTQGSNPGLLHCRQIFTSWATREAQKIHSFDYIDLCQ